MPYKSLAKNRKCKAKWQKENKDTHNEQSRVSYAKNRHKRRDKDLRKKGWTEESYQSAKKAQHNRCAICNKLCDSTHIGKLTADHKHVIPPVPRGLLCRTCNAGLGMFKDNVLLLKIAGEYLERYEDA